MTVKLSASHMELLDRLRLIYGVGRTNLLYRCLVEYLVNEGHEIPGILGKELRTPRLNAEKTIERSLSDLEGYCRWLSDAITTSVGARRIVRVNKHTQLILAHRLASWPTLPPAKPVASPPPAPPPTAIGDGLSPIPQALFLPPAQADAVRAAADQVGSFSTLLRSSLDAFATTYGLAVPGATMPTFARYPPPPLALALRSFEEPCLAVLYAMGLIDKREDRAVARPSEDLLELFRALFLIPHTDAPDEA